MLLTVTHSDLLLYYTGARLHYMYHIINISWSERSEVSSIVLLRYLLPVQLRFDDNLPKRYFVAAHALYIMRSHT